MAKVTPITLTYTVVLMLAVISLTLPAVNTYAGSNNYAAINSLAQSVHTEYLYNVYSVTNFNIYSGPSGLQATTGLIGAALSSLAFMFGAILQVATAAADAIPLVGTVLSAVSQYGILPDVDFTALFGLFISAVGMLLGWFIVAQFTKVEA